MKNELTIKEASEILNKAIDYEMSKIITMKGKVDNLKEQAYEQYQLMADKFLELHEYEDFILRKYSDDNIKELLMELDGILKQRWEDE